MSKTSRSKTSRSTKGEKSHRGSGKIKAGAEIGVDKSDRGSGKIKGGTEIGVEKGDRTLGEVKVGAEVKSDSLNEIKDAADNTLDNIKSGLKAARKKISNLYDK